MGSEEEDISKENMQFIDEIITKIIEDPTVTEYKFPSTLTSTERAYVHTVGKDLGFKTASRGKEPNRVVTLTRVMEPYSTDSPFSLLDTTKKAIQHSIQKQALSILPLSSEQQCNEPSVINHPDENVQLQRMGTAMQPQVPSLKRIMESRKSLPTWKEKDGVLEAIRNYPVVLITGETGCGKTTQIPQFILEDFAEQKKPCKIICSMPRRIAVLSVSERVAFERGSAVGQEVGYQIRLENRTSEKTILTFCTNGILLRMLMDGDAKLNSLTHLVLDEIHERDRLCDFMMIRLREVLKVNQHLKLILMSATMDSNLFIKYFTDAKYPQYPHLSVGGRLHSVEDYYLEDVLLRLNYETTKNKSGSSTESVPVENKRSVPTEIAERIDLYIDTFIETGLTADFKKLLDLMGKHSVTVDYQHTKSGMTCLMAAAAGRNLVAAEFLLSEKKANPLLQCVNSLTVSDYAIRQQDSEMLSAINDRVNADNVEQASVGIGSAKEELLNQYESKNKEIIDNDLILSLLLHIHHETELQGGILIFLPGCEEIMSLIREINRNIDDFQAKKSGNIYALPLHSKLLSKEQQKVFPPPPKGHRKIILATNIAETSVTINDIVYVIDCGKVKKKNYIAGAHMLKLSWISKACAKQRSGRAGRTSNGFCFHLFSKKDYNSFPDYDEPEIIRTPIDELCLLAKKLGAINMPIETFLGLAIEPPKLIAIKEAVANLKKMGAIDKDENLTGLGEFLSILPLDPQLGKILIYSIIFECLEPILTIVSISSHGNVFNTPTQKHLRNAVIMRRKELCGYCPSDHFACLIAFQEWRKASQSGRGKSWCDSNYTDSSSLQHLAGMRKQILMLLINYGLVSVQFEDYQRLNTNSKNWPVIKAVLCAGLYPRVAKFIKKGKALENQNHQKILVPTNSVLHKEIQTKLDWLVFEELNRYGYQICMSNGTAISTFTLLLMSESTIRFPDVEHAGEPVVEDLDGPQSKYTVLSIDNWKLQIEEKSARLLITLRKQVKTLIRNGLKNPKSLKDKTDSELLETIATALRFEEKGTKNPFKKKRMPQAAEELAW